VLSSEGTTVQDGVQSPETSQSSRTQKHHKSRTQHSAPASPSARRNFNWRGWGSPFTSLVGSKGWTFQDDETVHYNGIQAGWDIIPKATSMSPPRPDVTDEEGGSHSCGTTSNSHSSQGCSSSDSNSAAGLEFGQRSNVSAGVSRRKSPLRSLVSEKLRALIPRPRQSSEPKIGKGESSEFTLPKPSISGRKASEFRRASWSSERHEALIM